MASPFEQEFLANITERKRKRSDIQEGLERLKNVSVSELSDLCSVVSKEDILWLLQAKVPNALRLAEIVRAMPSAMPKATKNTLLAYYLNKFATAVGEIDFDKFVNVLQFCTADQQQKSGSEVTEMEILAPPIRNCTKCKSPLISQNKMCTVTVFSLQNVKSAMKLSCRCKECKLNFGYSMFGNVEEGYHFYQKSDPMLRPATTFS
ncbi:hypothetical protein OS493_025029 [Desmophyllum pertusum]|uniref:Uncharacterized protein n=1 Tax=Desmophyllum pertusum TaxID=174260 RepID=A0A9X0CKW9_9CNID|nr:hypothetical protein OS493_025029 [Desmophyllum pertusum]